MNQCGIYIIKNILSGRCYIGSSVNIRQRWYCHTSDLNRGKHKSITLNRSWTKHGKKVFVFEIIEIVDNPSDLAASEQYWMDYLDSHNPATGFNILKKAYSGLGYRHSKESRMRMSERVKGIKKSEAGAANIRNALLKKNTSLEMRGKVRASKLKLYANPEWRGQIAKHWADYRQKRKAAGLPIGHKQTDETRAKISTAKKGKMSEAHKLAIAHSNRTRVKNKLLKTLSNTIENAPTQNCE